MLQTLEEGVHNHHSPEKVMWLCVILQQLLDATKPPTVCFLAGVEPAAFKTFAKKVLKTKETVFIRKRINAILHEDSY